MATKSFVTKFEFSAKSAEKLIDAIENSKTHKQFIIQNATVVTDKKRIHSILKSFSIGSQQIE